MSFFSLKDSDSPLIIGVAGGSCSGKTTLIESTVELLGDEQCSVVYQDSYYRDQSDKFDHDGGSVNFDHPDAIDFDFLGEHLTQLKQGEAVEIPQYDFATHKRLSSTTSLTPSKLILVDGILIFANETIRQLLDYRIFIVCDEATRLSRRVSRDVAERGRTEDGVKAQFQAQVAPMHNQFVEPSKEFADIVINQESLTKYLNGEVHPLNGLLK